MAAEGAEREPDAPHRWPNCRHPSRGGAELARALRLEAVWAERDAEIEERLAAPSPLRFVCELCGARFIIQELLDVHVEDEHQEGGAAMSTSEERGQPAGRSYRCRLCGHVAPTFGELGRHRLMMHPEIYTKPRKRRPAVSRPASPAAAPKTHAGNGGDRCCPTCGGALPHQVAELVAELERAGIPEAQALQAAGIARRILTAA